MKKLYLPCLMLVASLTCLFLSCEKDDDSSGSESKYAEKFFSIENGTFHSEGMPESTTEATISGVEMNDYALTGGFNFISVNSNQEYDRFYVGVDGQNGYMEIPANMTTRTRDASHYYMIPIVYGQGMNSNLVMVIKARTTAGDITQGFRKTVTFVESEEGELTINLTFDRKKDLDLHLLTPSGKHIYYNAREWTVEAADGSTITYGLDHDSNADCRIDGLNNENIVIPKEAIEPGVYQVYIEMYKNCDKSIGTDLNWQLTVRYKGNRVKNLITMPGPGDNSMAFTDGATTLESTGVSPNNPVWGRYPYNHAGRTQKYVMDFKIKESTRSNAAPKIKCIYKPTATDMAKQMDREEGIE